jgi:hypothetical protein
MIKRDGLSDPIAALVCTGPGNLTACGHLHGDRFQLGQMI